MQRRPDVTFAVSKRVSIPLASFVILWSLMHTQAMNHDEDLASIFREMRQAVGVSKEQIAGRLGTTVETVEALESVAMLLLPNDNLQRNAWKP